MASIERYRIYLIILNGLMNLAAAANFTKWPPSYRKFDEWCLNHRKSGYCDKATNCNEGLGSDKSCFTVLPYDPSGMTVNQQHSACNYYSPYDVKVAEEMNGNLQCRYDIQDSQIGNTCYRLHSSTNKGKPCPDGYKIFKSTDSKERMWATILLNHGLEPVRIQFNGSTAAMSTKFDGMNGIDLGQKINLPTDNLKAICVKSAERIPNEERYDIADNDRVEYFVTDNVYQPEYDANNKPSVQKYHKIFPHSVAALPNDYLLVKDRNVINGNILHVAGQAKDFDTHPACNSYYYEQMFDHFVANDRNGSIVGINNTVYAFGYPNNKCADKPRTILTIHKTAGILNRVVDEPEFARHPLLCIRGSSPEKRRQFACEYGWKMSIRPNTNPYCFKHFYINNGLPNSLQTLNATYTQGHGSYYDSNHTEVKAICKDYFNASLPIIQYESD